MQKPLFQLFVAAILAMLLATLVAAGLVALTQVSSRSHARVNFGVVSHSVVAITPSDRPAPLGVAAPGAWPRRNSSIKRNAERLIAIPRTRCAIVQCEHAARDSREHGCAKATA